MKCSEIFFIWKEIQITSLQVSGRIHEVSWRFHDVSTGSRKFREGSMTFREDSMKSPQGSMKFPESSMKFPWVSLKNLCSRHIHSHTYTHTHSLLKKKHHFSYYAKFLFLDPPLTLFLFFRGPSFWQDLSCPFWRDKSFQKRKDQMATLDHPPFAWQLQRGS